MRHGRLRRRYGHARCATGSEVQSLLFPTARFTVTQARAWAKRHHWHFGDVDVKPEHIRLRQEDPALFQRMRTIFLGGSGVKAIVGWRVC